MIEILYLLFPVLEFYLLLIKSVTPQIHIWVILFWNDFWSFDLGHPVLEDCLGFDPVEALLLCIFSE